jgi:hypothetical protein
LPMTMYVPAERFSWASWVLGAVRKVVPGTESTTALLPGPAGPWFP